MVAFFIPGIVYLADAVGTQTETVVVRGLSLGISMRRMVGRELLAGLLIGVALAAVALPLVWLRWSDVRSRTVGGPVGIRGQFDGDAGGDDVTLAVRRVRTGSGLWQRSAWNRHSGSFVDLDLSVRHESRDVITLVEVDERRAT